MYEPLFEQIKSVPIILFFITVATLFAGERNLQQRAVYHLKISSAEQFTINVYFQHKKENIHANRDLYKIDQATRDRELKTQGVAGFWRKMLMFLHIMNLTLINKDGEYETACIFISMYAERNGCIGRRTHCWKDCGKRSSDGI